MLDYLKPLAWNDPGWGQALLFGCFITVEVALTSYLLGLAVGLMGAGAKLSRRPALHAFATSYSVVFRGVPELIVISLIYFGGSIAARAILLPFGFKGYVEFNPFLSGTLALGLITGAFATEVFRGAILAVPVGQTDAARSLGMSRFQTFFLVVFMQAMRLALPGLTNLWMAILKNTALLSVIGVVDMVRIASLGSAATRAPFPFFTAIAIAYLVLTTLSDFVIKRLEARLNRGNKTGQGANHV